MDPNSVLFFRYVLSLPIPRADDHRGRGRNYRVTARDVGVLAVLGRDGSFVAVS